MRIIQVSAHFPPNFVSGGTLQPQRIARELRSLGHDVSVLAGSLDDQRRHLEVWDEVDPTGLPVRWVATREHIWWDDERNYDSNAVEAIADALYESWRPDLIHLHSLQTLGVGAIRAAARRGVPVVVTMHDFWWVCARQFLVDTEGRPCCLVVDASDCPCEAGRAHLDVRTRRLRAALAEVDQILVPSAAAAEVLVANGIDLERLAVDENGLPEPDPFPSTPRSPRVAGRVTARYTGGANALKGADVLIEALLRTGPLDHVEVVAHGLDEALARHGLRAEDVPVELLAPYDPSALDTVLAHTDVLLLPSVMRETYSIVTREALSRGVPVVATDVLGPEEVIEDGRNGRIIPAGDPDALAEVLSSIDDDPGIVDRWRADGVEVDVRTVRDQVSGLVARYESLIEGGHSGRPIEPRKRVVFVVGIQGAPLRYRAQVPAEALAVVGIHADVLHYLDPALERVSRSATHIVVYRVPATPHILGLMARWRADGIPVAFDADDLIFDPDIAAEIPALQLLAGDEARLWLEGVRRYRTTMEACDAYIGSTAGLVAHARDVVGLPAFLVENGVGRAVGAASDRALRRARRPGPVRIGYLSGTTTHDDDWRAIAPAVLRALERHRDVELWLGGHLEVNPALSAALGGRLRRIPFLPWNELPEVLRDLDVNLAPLASASRFNEAKSAIKWLEAALCETPTIASATQPFRAAVEPGITGLLADDANSWESALDFLILDDGARIRMGRRARRAALLRWSPSLQGRRYAQVLDDMTRAHEHARTPSPGWEPVVCDELPARRPVPLDEYPGSAHPERTAISSRQAFLDARSGRIRRVLGVIGSSLRAEGFVATGRRILRAVIGRLGARRTR